MKRYAELAGNRKSCRIKSLQDNNLKTGKTTTACKFPKPLLLAFEAGYLAIPGAMALPINKWSEFKQVLRQLKDDKAHELYENVIIDTAKAKFAA